MPNLVNCGEYAFSNSGIVEIEAGSFPKLERQSGNAFMYCTSLKKATFENLKSISNQCFYGCSNLSELILLSNAKVVLAATQAFSNTPLASHLGQIYVPRSLVDIYKSDSLWKTFIISAYEDYPVSLGTIHDSWNEILAAETDGSYLQKYSIGDTKFQQIGDYTFDLEIVSFDKDDLADGTGKAHITWFAKHIMFKAPMGSSNTNLGGWASCKLRSDLRNMLNTSDSDFKSAVKEVNKTYFDYNDHTTKTVADTIWIPS